MPDAPENLPCSIVIITRNRARILDDCLRHVLRQEGPSFEAIVVDASDGDETARVVAGYDGIRYLHLSDAHEQMPRSRNEGIRAARGDVVAFVDDDSMVQPGWLLSLLRHYARPSVGGAGGLVIAPGEQPRPSGVVGAINRRGTPIGSFNVRTDGPVAVEHLMGCNMSFRRQLLLGLGGFDQRYDGSNFREETDLCVRVRRVGFELIYDPTAAVLHLYSSKESYGRSDASDARYRFSVAKNTAYFKLKHFRGPLTILSLLGGPVATLSGALAGRQNFAIAAAQATGQWAGLKTYLTNRGAHRAAG